MYRLLVTGGRDLPEAEIVWMPLWMLLHKKHALIVMHGDHDTGADLFAQEWVELPGQPWNRGHRRYEPKVEYLALEERHPPDFTRFSKRSEAFHARNQEMVDAGADAVFAFPTPASKGTFDCMARAWVRGIPVFIWHHLEPGRTRRLTEAEGEQLARQRLRWPDNMSDPHGKVHA